MRLGHEEWPGWNHAAGTSKIIWQQGKCVSPCGADFLPWENLFQNPSMGGLFFWLDRDVIISGKITTIGEIMKIVFVELLRYVPRHCYFYFGIPDDMADEEAEQLIKKATELDAVVRDGDVAEELSAEEVAEEIGSDFFSISQDRQVKIDPEKLDAADWDFLD